jgi:hypothetical protein
MMFRRGPSTDQSNTLEAGAHQTNLTVNLGGPTITLILALLAVICLAAWVIGENTAERRNQEALQRQHELTLQREMQTNQLAMQREWEKQTALLTEHMDELKRQYRMAELKLDDWTVVAHRRGLVLPGDYTRGPQGNLDSQSFQEQHDGSRRDH